jgi:hypothetical protein
MTIDLSLNFISAPVFKSVKLELVLCQMRNARTREVDASREGFDDADVVHIAEALPANTTLVTLHLSCNLIGDAGVVAISHGLRCALMEAFGLLLERFASRTRQFHFYRTIEMRSSRVVQNAYLWGLYVFLFD